MKISSLTLAAVGFYHDKDESLWIVFDDADHNQRLAACVVVPVYFGRPKHDVIIWPDLAEADAYGPFTRCYALNEEKPE